jgi:hypothetical protein
MGVASGLSMRTAAVVLRTWFTPRWRRPADEVPVFYGNASVRPGRPAASRRGSGAGHVADGVVVA